MTKPANDFWSRRKAKVAEEAEVEAVVVDEIPQEELTDDEILAKFDLPDPDTLKLGDDIKGFMSKAVPERLRRRALRKLWRTNPVLACLDGLNDYDDDFTDVATVFPDMKTAYQVGKGMLAHLEAVAKQADALLATNDTADVGLDHEDDPEDTPEVETVMSVAQPAQSPTEEEPQPAPRRRMQLQFHHDHPSEAYS
jgi:hypothetical protein